MTGGQYRPLLVAGVAGGVGTSTWARILRFATSLPIEDLREYRGGPVDVLVTSNTAASTSRLGSALAACPRPPLLVVMHTVPGVIAESRSYLRTVEPHITDRFDVGHQRMWLEMDSAPGERLPVKVKEIAEALRRFPQALQAMYAVPIRQIVPTPPPGRPAPMPMSRPSPVVPRAGPAQQRWTPPPGGAPPNVVHRGSQGG